MAVYTPEEERRLRLHLPSSRLASKQAGHEWAQIDISDEFEAWMAAHEYRDAYFENPKLIQPELAGFFDAARRRSCASSSQEASTPNTDRRTGWRRQPFGWATTSKSRR